MRKFRLVGLGRTPQATGPETTASLLAAGLDARAAELASATPLQRAAAEGHVDIVHQLLKHGADVNHQDAVHGNSALHEAAWRGYSQTATILVRHQKTSSNYCCNVNAVNRAGFTPLHLCCQNGHNETCRVLLIANASPNVKNHYGDTPLHTSGRYGHAGVMRILLSANCNVAEQNKNGDTALHIAAAMGRRKLTRILLGAGCPINIKNKQGELAVDIARRKEFHEIVTMLQKGPSAAGKSKSRSASSGKKREKGGTTGSAASSSRDSSSKQRHKERKRQKKEKSTNGHVTTSPYGCHANPELAKRLHPKLNSLPNEPLRQGEQYYLDLAGNIQKGPVGVQTCYCGPVLHRLECRLAKDKQDILQRLDSAHLRLDARIDGLERKTQLQLQGLQRTVDSLGLESSPAGIQRVRNSIVLADPGHTTPPLPSLDFMSNSSHSQYGSDAEEEDVRNNNSKQPNEVQYTLDKLGLDMADGRKQPGLQALRDRLAQTRIREQRELDDIVEHYEKRHVTIKEEEAQVEIHQEEEDSEESEDEEEEEEEEVSNELPPVLDSGKCAPMMSDSRYENYDYPPNKTSSGTNGISYRNLPLPRYHLDPVLETNGTTVDHKSPIPSGLTVIDPVNNRTSQQQHFVVPIYHHEDRDRHNDSGYSTRPGESSQGPSPSLSAGLAESLEGEHHHPVLMSPRSIRRSELFQSHFARDLAQTLPSHPTGTTATSNGVGPAYPRVRFAVPNEHESLLFPPGTISSSSLV